MRVASTAPSSAKPEALALTTSASSRSVTCGGGSMSFCRFWMAIRSFCLLSATTWMENKAGMAGQSEAICPLGEGWPRLEASLSLIWRWRGVLEGEVA